MEFNFTNKKYILLKPNIANIFDVYTIKAFVVIEKIAGIESRANIISENSIKIKIRRSGVA